MSVEDVQKWVDRLNAMTPEQIRRLMWEEDIQGRVQDSLCCPLSVLIWKKTGSRVSTCGAYIRSVKGNSYLNVSESVRKFVYAVDNLEYPELIEDEEGVDE